MDRHTRFQISLSEGDSSGDPPGLGQMLEDPVLNSACNSWFMDVLYVMVINPGNELNLAQRCMEGVTYM